MTIDGYGGINGWYNTNIWMGRVGLNITMHRLEEMVWVLQYYGVKGVIQY